MDSPTPSNSSIAAEDEEDRTFSDARTTATEDDMNLNISGVNSPAIGAGFTIERPHTSPPGGESGRPAGIIPMTGPQQSPRLRASPIVYNYTPTLRSRPSDPTIRRTSAAAGPSSPLTYSPQRTGPQIAPHPIGAASPPPNMWSSVSVSANTSPGPAVRSYTYSVATPWAPDHGAGPGDFPVGVFAERESLENKRRSRSASDVTNTASHGIRAQQSYGQDVPGIGRPRLRRVLSRERWGSDGLKK
jgi:hypothetical protein